MSKHITWCYQISDILIYFQSSHETVLDPFYDSVDLCLLDVVLASCEERKFHHVAAESTHWVSFRHKDWFLASFRYYWVLTIWFSHKLSLHDLNALVEPVWVVTYFGEIIVPCHFLHDVDSQHLQRMCIKMQGTENFLETESDAWLTGKEIVQLHSKLCLVHSFASFFSFSHNSKS